MSATATPPAQDWRAIDWPAHTKRAMIAGTELNYVDIGSGSGPPLLLIHGLGAHWRVWLPTIPALAAHRRVIVPDLPGCGESAMPAGPTSVAGFAEAMDELCEELGIGPSVVAGSSLGGCVAAEMAIFHPARVEKLMLVSAVGIHPGRGEWARTLPVIWAGALLGNQIGRSREQIAARPGLRRAVLAKLVHDAGRLDPDLVFAGLLEPPGPGARDAIRAGLDHISPESESRLARIRCPTLIVWGEDDQLLPMRHADAFRHLIAGSRLITFENTGHLPMVEQPGQFNATLLDFIEL